MSFGVTGVMPCVFTSENLGQYAVLGAMGATSRQLVHMLFAQAGMCALPGTGMGLGLGSLAGKVFGAVDYPFRMMWFTPIFGMTMVTLVGLVAALLSVRPVLKLSPAVVFAGRRCFGRTASFPVEQARIRQTALLRRVWPVHVSSGFRPGPAATESR